VQNPGKNQCGNECENLENFASFHNAKLWFFLRKKPPERRVFFLANQAFDTRGK